MADIHFTSKMFAGIFFPRIYEDLTILLESTTSLQEYASRRISQSFRD